MSNITADALQRQAARSAQQIAAAKQALVESIRRAHTAGMSQREIATAIGKSQPEVNRLLRFHGTSPNGRLLRRKTGVVRQILATAGLSNPRVFGSTARGEDKPGSDIDLLVKADNPLSLLEQSKVEIALNKAVGAKIDLVFEDEIRADLRKRILGEAVPL